MAFDSATDELVLFGGFDGSVNLNDTWTWDGSNWTEQASVTSPPVRSLAQMAYDPANEAIVLFSGNGPTVELDDTWISAEQQSIAFTSTSSAVYGTTYQPTATATSGLPVTISIDASSTPGACSLASGTVAFTGSGSCVLDANQGGDGYFAPAPSLQPSRGGSESQQCRHGLLI
jgi:hypothetical protein